MPEFGLPNLALHADGFTATAELKRSAGRETVWLIPMEPIESIASFGEKAEMILVLLRGFLRPFLSFESWEYKMRTTCYLLFFITQLLAPSNLVAGGDLLEQLKALELQAREISVKK